MRTFFALLLVAFASLPAAGQPVGPPANGSGTVATVQTPVTGTIGLGNAFRLVLPADTARKSCIIPNTTQHVMYVWAVPPGGSMADATLLNSIPVAPSGSFNCAAGSTVITNQIAITTNTGTDPFVAWFSR